MTPQRNFWQKLANTPIVTIAAIGVLAASGLSYWLVRANPLPVLQGPVALVITATDGATDTPTAIATPIPTDTPIAPPPLPTATPAPSPDFAIHAVNTAFHCDFQQVGHEGVFTITNIDTVDHAWGTSVSWTPSGPDIAFNANPNSSTSAGNTEVHPSVTQGVGVIGSAPVGTVVTVTVYLTDNGMLGGAQGQVQFTCD